jgi:hypothetical protein
MKCWLKQLELYPVGTEICQEAHELGRVGVPSSNSVQGQVQCRKESSILIFQNFFRIIAQVLPIPFICVEVFTQAFTSLAEIDTGSSKCQRESVQSLNKLNRIGI